MRVGAGHGTFHDGLRIRKAIAMLEVGKLLRYCMVLGNPDFGHEKRAELHFFPSFSSGDVLQIFLGTW